VTCPQSVQRQIVQRNRAIKSVITLLSSTIIGFDHGVGHSLLLLYDVKAPNGQKSKEFKDLGHYLSDASLITF
jgi:hypothetical protein